MQAQSLPLVEQSGCPQIHDLPSTAQELNGTLVTLLGLVNRR